MVTSADILKDIKHRQSQLTRQILTQLNEDEYYQDVLEYQLLTQLPKCIYQDQIYYSAKQPINCIKLSSSLHNTIVGIYGLNNLQIPNFTYIYAATETEILVDPLPNLTLADYLLTCDSYQFGKIYLQILYALNYAKVVDFTHYNLIPELIYIKEYDQQFLIDYGDYCLITDTIAIITNYSFSHISDFQSHIGYYKQIAHSIFPVKSWVMTDVYKLLLSSASINNLAYMKHIFSYFSDENFVEAIDQQYLSGYNLCYNSRTSKLSLKQFITHVEIIYNYQIADCLEYQIVDHSEKIMRNIISQVKKLTFSKVNLWKIDVLNDVQVMYDNIAKLVVLFRDCDKFADEIEIFRKIVFNNSQYFNNLNVDIVHDQRLLWYWDKMNFYEDIIFKG